MKKSMKFLRENFSCLALSAFWLFALINPLFKKYDYGGGFPLILLLGALLAVIAFFEFRQKRESAMIEKVFLLVFGLFVGLSFYFSQTKNLGFSEVLAFVSMIPLYFLFAHKKIEWLGSFLRIVGLGAILSVVIGYFIYFARPEVRMFGTFFNLNYHAHVWPNAFALFLLMVWPIFLLFAGKKSQWQAAILIGFLFSALFLTYSRGAFIVLGGQVVLMLIYFLKRIRLQTIGLVLLTILTAVFFFYSSNSLRSLSHEVLDMKERVTFGNEESLTSKQERIDFWFGARELAMEKPLFGWGPYSFRQAYNGRQATLLGSADHPHNVFLKIGAENGLIALGAFLAFLLAVFAVTVKRFSKLSKMKKDTVYVLGVSVLGAFAHNLIDYNLNFIANLFLLFIFIIFIRSLVIKRVYKAKKAVLGMAMALVVGIFSLYEGGILFLSEVKDESYLEYSFFPRNYYLNEADEALNNEDFETALRFVEAEIALNPLDSQAWYLKGAVYCNSLNAYLNLEICLESFDKAISLNPMNDFSYYLGYFQALRGDMFVTYEELEEFAREVMPLIKTYFDYVENNVHFTAYTSNVEAAYTLTDNILSYLPVEEDVTEIDEKKEKMLETAKKLRAKKTY